MSKIKLLLSLVVTIVLMACASEVPPDLLEEPQSLEKVKPEYKVVKNWAVNLGGGAGKQRLSFVPAVTETEVYAADIKGRVWAIDRKSGRKIWKVDLDKALSAGPSLQFNQLYLASQSGTLVALDKSTGAVIWSTQLDSELLSVPTAVAEELYAATIDGQVYRLDPENGAILWRYGTRVPALTLRGSSGVVLADEVVLYGAADGRLVALDRKTGIAKWESTVSVGEGRSELARIVDIDADPLVYRGIAYVVTYQGHIAAVDVVSGVLLWRRDMSSYTGLTIVNDQLFVTDSSSQIWALSRRTGAALWKQDALLYRNLTAPTLHENLIVIGDGEGYLHWISSENGEFMARRKLAGQSWLSPLVAQQQDLYALSSSGKLVSLHLEAIE